MRELTASWLSTRWGVDTVRINALRRDGELLAVRPAGAADWGYPAWQFDAAGKVRPEVQRVLAVARQRRIPSERLSAVLQRRNGMTGETLLDALLRGNADSVIAALT